MEQSLVRQSVRDLWAVFAVLVACALASSLSVAPSATDTVPPQPRPRWKPNGGPIILQGQLVAQTFPELHTESVSQGGRTLFAKFDSSRHVRQVMPQVLAYTNARLYWSLPCREEWWQDRPNQEFLIVHLFPQSTVQAIRCASYEEVREELGELKKVNGRWVEWPPSSAVGPAYLSCFPGPSPRTPGQPITGRVDLREWTEEQSGNAGLLPLRTPQRHEGPPGCVTMVRPPTDIGCKWETLQVEEMITQSSKPKHVSRFELRWMKKDWRHYLRSFGHLPLSRKQWRNLTTEGLARFLRQHGAEVERARDGNPGLCVRMPEALQDWVAAKGGPAYVRAFLEEQAVAELGAAAYGWVAGPEFGEFRLWNRGERSWICLPIGQEPEPSTKGYRHEYTARHKVTPDTALAPAVTPSPRSFAERLFGDRPPTWARSG